MSLYLQNFVSGRELWYHV